MLNVCALECQLCSVVCSLDDGGRWLRTGVTEPAAAVICPFRCLAACWLDHCSSLHSQQPVRMQAQHTDDEGVHDYRRTLLMLRHASTALRCTAIDRWPFLRVALRAHSSCHCTAPHNHALRHVCVRLIGRRSVDLQLPPPSIHPSTFHRQTPNGQRSPPPLSPRPPRSDRSFVRPS